MSLYPAGWSASRRLTMVEIAILDEFGWLVRLDLD